MKESFNDVYTRLYKENFEELEMLRKKKQTSTLLLILGFIFCFFLTAISPLFIIIYMVIFIICLSKGGFSNRNKSGGPSYTDVFKEKVMTPLIQNTIEGAVYSPYSGISRLEYRKAGYGDNEDRYRSEDLVSAPIVLDENTKIDMVFAEVLTEVESTDDEGNRTYSTVFSGLAGQADIHKNINSRVYIRSNRRVSRFNKDKVNMDMSEFERIFDVEAKDKILAMRILTADIMSDMIDLYEKYGYKYEIHILDNKLYMRVRTGPMFEPNVFKSSMEYKTIEKYYLVLTAFMKIAEKICSTIDKLEI